MKSILDYLKVTDLESYNYSFDLTPCCVVGHKDELCGATAFADFLDQFEEALEIASDHEITPLIRVDDFNQYINNVVKSTDAKMRWNQLIEVQAVERGILADEVRYVPSTHTLELFNGITFGPSTEPSDHINVADMFRYVLYIYSTYNSDDDEGRLHAIITAYRHVVMSLSEWLAVNKYDPIGYIDSKAMRKSISTKIGPVSPYLHFVKACVEGIAILIEYDNYDIDAIVK